MTIAHVSEKPWSEYTKTDYTPEQWHRACLIHQHSGPPTSKGQCKLPVRTPAGAVNRNGVHAAAAALAGARGGVQASPDEIASARRALARLYAELDEDMPDSLQQDNMFDEVDKFLEHYGIKGMRWGKRRSRAQIDNSPDAPEHTRARSLQTVAKTSGIRKLTNKDLQDLNNRLNLEQSYTRLTASDKGKSAIGKGAGWFGKRVGTVGNSLVDEVAKAHLKVALTQKGIMPTK
jgi:ribosomal protein L29